MPNLVSSYVIHDPLPHTAPSTACPPPCPACGGLQCLCRPRFFPGQLLTDEDLNRLDRYVVEKNKLHNRYLHGWGVVCGLRVDPDPCEPGFIVRTGYALSPCGEDIVVCKDTRVDVCRLIDACRDRTREPDCDPPVAGPGSPCDGGIEEWVLAICYCEAPSRGVVALRASSACDTGCTCGSGTPTAKNGAAHGAKTAACHCGASTSSTKSTRRATPVQCEPTQVCESFQFRVYKRVQSRRDIKETGAIRKKIQQHVYEVTRDLPDPPAELDGKQRYLAWWRDTHDAVYAKLVEHPSVEPAMIERVAAFTPPVDLVRMADAKVKAAASAAVAGLVGVLAGLVRRDICAALLPSCPPHEESNCVPLASFKIDRREPCRPRHPCNWGVRRLVLSATLLRPWLDALSPFFDKFGALIEKHCCPQIVGQPAWGPVRFLPEHAKLAKQALRAAIVTERTVDERSKLSRELLEGAFTDRSRALDPEALLLGALGAVDARSQPLARPEELEDVGALLLLNEVLRPAIDAAFPDTWTGAANTGRRARRGSSGTAAVDELRKSIDELREKVKAQDKEIARLKTRPR